MKHHRIVVGLSGGVDSAVTAHLLKKQGHEVVGIFMKNWEDDDDSEFCSSNIDFVDAAAVADVVGIEIEHVNFAADYKDRVFAEFLREYQAGRTPNPDILCNAEIKFKSFLDHAMHVGAQKIATGHYARVRLNEASGRHELLKGLDNSKDQSYFLHRLNQAQLSKTLFPVGELLKTQVRQIAEEIGLPNAKKKDSTGICFIGEQDFKTFLARYLPAQPGAIETLDGQVIGQHGGALYFTVGQRAPLGGVKGFPSESWFVLAKDVARNVLVVGQGANHPALMAGGLTTEVASWIAGAPPAEGFDAEVQLRHLGAAEPARVRVTQDGTLDVRFANPVRAVAPGQAAVVYQGEVCLGGAPIVAALAP